jgi:hypothetical protein
VVPVPHAWAFGWLVLIGELVVGAVLLGATSVFLVRRHRLQFSTRQVLLIAIALASIGGILMNISFHLANGDPHPWLLPKSGFDQGVDLDSLMPLIQLATVIVAIKAYLLGRKSHRRPNSLP